MRLSLVALSLAFVVGLAGCGGDSGGNIKPYDASSGEVAKPLPKPGSPGDAPQPGKGKPAGPGGGPAAQ